MAEEKKKDIWDKASVLAALLVPIVIALVGHAYTSALKEAEIRVKYTELAISILKEKPAQDTKDVRAWSVDVINKYSGVPMDANVRKQLLGSRLIQSNFTNSNFLESDFKGSIFVRSNFTVSNFDQSLFLNASFRKAIFTGADLRGADLSQARIDDQTQLPLDKPGAKE